MKSAGKISAILFFIAMAGIGFTCCSGNKSPEQPPKEEPVVIPPPEEDEEFQPGEFQTTASLDAMWLTVQANAAGIDTRDICEFLAEAAGSNWPQQRLRTTLYHIAALQIRNDKSPYYGNFLWTKGDNVPMTITSSFDINGVLFCNTYLTLLRKLYYNKLDADNKSLLNEILRLSLISVKRDIDDRRAAYTNTWLMRTWILCGLGEALNDAAVLNLGKESLREWMQNIYRYGVVEYNSSNYGNVALRPLGYLASLIQDSEIKREAGIGLKYFRHLYVGNFVSYDDRGMVLGGTQSRNTNYTHSKAGRDIFCRMFTGRAFVFIDKDVGWALSAEDKTLYQQKNRTLIYKNGTTDVQFAIHYVGSNFSLGSTGKPYGNHDKPFVLNFFDASRPVVVHVSSVMDGRQDPYGERVLSNGRARHLHDYLSARAQRVITSGSEMVFLLAADGRERDDTERLNHYTIIPTDKQDGLWNGNTRILSLTQQLLSSADNHTFFIRFSDVAAGIRYLKVLDNNGADVISGVKLVNEPNVSTEGTAMYLQAQLSTGRPAAGACGVIAVWWRVKEGITSDTQFTAFRNEMINAPIQFNQSGNEYTVKVTSPDGELGVSGNKSTKLQTANYGGLTLPPGGNFVVNGTDLAPSLFSGSTYVK